MDDSWGLKLMWPAIYKVISSLSELKWKLYSSGQENELIRLNILSQQTLKQITGTYFYTFFYNFRIIVLTIYLVT